MADVDRDPALAERRPAPGGATRVDTDAWGFDDAAEDSTTLDIVDSGRGTAAVDRNGHHALLHLPPIRAAGNGDPAPFVGFDATARSDLWQVALGGDIDAGHLHDAKAEAHALYEEALGLWVIQATDQPPPYRETRRARTPTATPRC